MTKIEQIRAPQQAKAAQRVAEKARVNPAAVLRPTATEQPPVTVHSAESELDLAHSDFERARDRLLDAAGFGATNHWPQWIRNTCALIADVTLGYGIYVLGRQLIEMLVVAAGGSTLSALSFTAFSAMSLASMAIYLLGFIVGIALMYMAGKYVGRAISSGAVDRFIMRIVKAPFASSEVTLAPKASHA